MIEYHIFFDDGGVMNDNLRRGQQCRELIADFFIPKYGGTREEWKNANIAAADGEIKEMHKMIDRDPFLDFNQWNLELQYNWIKSMFDILNIATPDRESTIKLSLQAQNWITTRIDTAYEGIIEVIKKLSNEYMLHIASGETSGILDGYLQGMGVRNCFIKLYGPDLVNQMKGHPRFYLRIFNDLEIKPQQAIIIEDKPNMNDQISDVGAIPVQSLLTSQHQKMTKYAFSEPHQVLEFIKNITA